MRCLLFFSFSFCISKGLYACKVWILLLFLAKRTSCIEIDIRQMIGDDRDLIPAPHPQVADTQM